MIRECYERLRERYRWWHARRYGSRPTCDGCGENAIWIMEPEGVATCGFRRCNYDGQNPGIIRDPEPADWVAEADNAE